MRTLLPLLTTAGIAIAQSVGFTNYTACGRIGFDTYLAYFYEKNASYTFDGCRAKCASDPACLSFATGNTAEGMPAEQHECYLYNHTMVDNYRPMSIYNQYAFYSASCDRKVEYGYPDFKDGPPVAPSICGAKGYHRQGNVPVWILKTAENMTQATCLAECRKEPNCAAYMTDSMTQCRLFWYTADQFFEADSTSAWTIYDRQCIEPTSVCGLVGYDKSGAPPPITEPQRPAYWADSTGAFSSWSACHAKCADSEYCLTFAFGDGQCLLYDIRAELNTQENTASPYTFFHRDCPSPAA